MKNLFKANAIVVSLVLLISQSALAQSVLTNAFAHNDYKHKRPLYDALQWGVANIEADIFLYKNKLVVAHVVPYFRGGKTLEDLYFKPLLDRFKLNSNIYSGYSKPIVLMIDIKTDRNKTYIKLNQLLVKYQAMLTSYNNGVITPGAVTVIISGHKPYEMMAKETFRLAFIDDDLKNNEKNNYKSDLCLMASAKFSNITSWDGKKPMSADEKSKLCAYISQAHTDGKIVRLWAIPQSATAWNTLMDCGVDLINSDNLEGMSTYFARKKLNEGYAYSATK
jgi:hypothetical protein